MPSIPYVGIGDSLEFASDGSPSTFTVLNGVTSIAVSGDKVATEKTTTMASPNGVDTFIASTQDPGTLDVKGMWYPGDATQMEFEAARLTGASGIPIPFKVTYGSSNSLSCDGIIESFTPSFPLEKVATFDAKIKISGVKVYV
jgi:hypothetical protein